MPSGCLSHLTSGRTERATFHATRGAPPLDRPTLTDGFRRYPLRLLEWSYPRNWESFVWNDEEGLEYTLSPYLFPWLAA